MRGTVVHFTDLATWPATRHPEITYHSANASPSTVVNEGLFELVLSSFSNMLQFLFDSVEGLLSSCQVLFEAFLSTFEVLL